MSAPCHKYLLFLVSWSAKKIFQWFPGSLMTWDRKMTDPTNHTHTHTWSPTNPFALLWCWGTMMFMIILSIERPSVIAKWKVFAMWHLFFPWLFLLLLCFCLLSPSTSFLVMDTIPYVILGTCSTSIHVNLMFCCCWPSFLPPFFTYRKPITPF